MIDENLSRRSAHGGDPGRSLGAILTAAKARWVVVVVATVVGGMAGYAFSNLWPPQYMATARVQIGPGLSSLAIGSGLQGSAVSAQTEARLASSPEVLRAALDTVDSSRSPDELSAVTTVTNLEQTNLLDMSVTDPARSDAVELASAIATAYLDRRADVAEAEIDAVLQSTEGKIEALRQQLRRSGRAGAPEGEIAVLRQRISALSDLVTNATVLYTQPGAVVERASDNVERVGADRETLLIAGTLAGFVVGVLLANLGEAWRPRLRRGQLHSEVAGVPVIAEVDTRDGLRPLEEILSFCLSSPSASRGQGLGILVVGDGSHSATLADNLAAQLAELDLGGGHVQVLGRGSDRRTERMNGAPHLATRAPSDLLVARELSVRSLQQLAGCGGVLIVAPRDTVELGDAERVVDLARSAGVSVEGVVTVEPQLAKGARLARG